jgi:hypothetical protein
MKQNIIATLILLSLSAQLQAMWDVMSHTDTDSGLQTDVATIENEKGYKLEIYRDANDVIRSRFNMRNGYDLLAAKHCPTFQVDKRDLSNRSINDAPCISQARWSEHVFGYITDEKVLSLPLHNLMNGNVIYYRFILQNGSYGETSFSLSGSKSVIYNSIGKDLSVLKRAE